MNSATTLLNEVTIPKKYEVIDQAKGKVNRTWGSYKWAYIGSNFVVKIVTIPPGKSQKFHRHLCKSKAVVVTQGCLQIKLYDEDTHIESDKLIRQNFSYTIPVGTIHALHNPSRLPLEIVEIQTGAQVTENDVYYCNFENGHVIDLPPKEEKVDLILEPTNLKDNDSFLDNSERPWGKWYSIVKSNNYQVKVIEVMPGHRLSDQLHYLRSEHWIIVGGAAKVEREKDLKNIGDKEITEKIYKFGESLFIPSCTRHRILNPSPISTMIVEVQVGEYLGEDDIVRFQDDYDRT